MLELMTKTPYGVSSFRSLMAADVLIYPELLKERQLNAIQQLNEVYYKDKYYKNKKFFSIVPYPFSVTDRMVSAATQFEKKKQKPFTNYTNSYHITITLPFIYAETSLKDYRAIYTKFINQIQWIEPLLVAMYSTGDMRKIGSNKKYPRASFRIMLVGWGNPGGSDVRKFDEGLTRKANIPLYWRDGVNFIGQEKLEKICMDPSKLSEYRRNPHFPRTAIYDMGGDIRTFTRDLPGDEERNLPTNKLFGIEIRIFDGFPIRYLSTLVRIIVFLAENSRRTPAKMFVYKDKDWQGAMQAIMGRGWRSELPKGYMDKMEKALDLKFPKKPTLAAAFWDVLLDQLWKKNKNGLYVRLMLPQKFSGDETIDGKQIKINIEKREQPPLVHVNINRQAWDYGFLIKLQNDKALCKKIIAFTQQLQTDKKLSLDSVFSVFKKHLTPSWDESFEDVLYFFSIREGMSVYSDSNGLLTKVKFSAKQKKLCKEIIENRVGEIVKLWPELLIYAQGKDSGKEKE
jgi:hypothetical protein